MPLNPMNSNDSYAGFEKPKCCSEAAKRLSSRQKPNCVALPDAVFHNPSYFTRGRIYTRNVDVLRTGKLGRGLEPEVYDRVLEAFAAKDLEASQPLLQDHIDWGMRESAQSLDASSCKERGCPSHISNGPMTQSPSGIFSVRAHPMGKPCSVV